MLDSFANGTDELSGLCNRLLDKMHKLWTFSEFTNVEPANNLADRDLRKLLLWRKKAIEPEVNEVSSLLKGLVA